MLPTDVPDLAADVPKVCMSRKTALPLEMKDIFDADTEENHWESHILLMRDKAALSGGYGMSTSSAKAGRSAERWRRLVLVTWEPDPGPPQAWSWEGRKFVNADITVGTAAEDRRAFNHTWHGSLGLTILFRVLPFPDSSLHFRALWPWQTTCSTTKVQYTCGLQVCPRHHHSRFEPWNHVLSFWKVDESNHRHLLISTHIYQVRRLWVLVCWF